MFPLSVKENNVSPIRSKSNSTSPLKGSPTKKSKTVNSPSTASLASPSISPSKKLSRRVEPCMKASKSRSSTPVKFKTNSPSPAPISGPNFKIFEDNSHDKKQEIINRFNDLDVVGQENDITMKSEDDIDSNDYSKDTNQENILQPKLKSIPQHGRPRIPLSNLSIDEFKGYLHQPQNSLPNQSHINLQEPFIPKTFKNDFNSQHRFYNNMPSYISPVKSNQQYLFKSGLDSIQDCNEINEDDIIEQHLRQKLLLMKHKRSHSLGKNDLKFDLIKKNDFTILSN